MSFSASNVWGISDDGKIVGTAFASDGGTYAVLWTPVPEPSAWQIVACMVVAAIIRARRRYGLWKDSKNHVAIRIKPQII